ncbi:hypothetical protein QN277_004662 [Acacia crassicarpa]|uniref:Uncharacterized protein n=1 Tax=Acacia crassicarpa TaxID=499986 RepID=A0AAE1J0U7_9FABA|nr:hypothetical protein QN277_004662 [Acacia crassicarpa]
MVIQVIMVALVVVMTPLILGLLCTAHFISAAKVIHRNHHDNVMGMVAGDHSRAWLRRSAFGRGRVVHHHYLMSETGMIRSPAPHVEA